MKPRNRLLSLYAFIVYIFLFAPIVVLIIFSFNDSKRSVNWKGFTLDWYPALFTDQELLDALSVTLRLAVVVVIVSTVVGTLLGLALARVRFRGRAATETLLLLPMVTPEIIMGLSLLVFFSAAFGSRGSFTQLVFAQVTFCISYVAIVVRARASGMNAAARGGGSRPGRLRPRRVPLRDAATHLPGGPLGRPVRRSRSRSTTTSSRPSTPGSAPRRCRSIIYGKVKFGVTPEINAISTIIVAVTAVAVLIAWYSGQRRGEVRAVAEPDPTELEAPEGSSPEPGTGPAKAGARA